MIAFRGYRIVKMVTNLLKAVVNIKKNDSYNLSKVLVIPKLNPSTVNRANSVGDALEFFMRDSFVGTFNEKNAQAKKDAYDNNFSYLGNQNNPPDLMIKGGDALEIKKINGINFSDLALNSSYPKSKLYSDSPMITSACKDCEGWKEKDMIYAVGSASNQELKILAFVYGDCYAANREVYERIQKAVSGGLKKLDLELGKTNELGRVNKVDPLGITNLRIRGMWTIKHPLSVFSDIISIKKKENSFSLVVLMRNEKYESFPKADRQAIENDKGFNVKNVKIQDPDNPAKQLNAVLITYFKK